MTMRFLAFALLFFTSLASAQITTHYDPSGGIVERVYEGTTNGTRWAYTTSNGQWHSTPASSPNVAGVTVGRNVTIGSSQGASVAGKLPVLIESEFTAAALAKSGIGVLRGGLVGIAINAALDLALREAHLGFDAAVNSVVYNPDPTRPEVCSGGCYWTITGYNQSGRHFGSPAEAGQSLASDLTALTGDLWQVCNIVDRPPPQSTSVYFKNTPRGGVTSSCGSGQSANRVGSGTQGDPTCPNGVQFNNVTQCRQLISDEQGGIYLGPKINHGNGPDIGTNVSGGTGVHFQPDGGVMPSNGPGIDVDPNSWPQVSGPASQSYGPQTTTSSSVQTSTGANGQPITTTTTTTVTNTTNITNTYNNNTSVTNIDNKTQKTVCHASGVCTNETTHTAPPGQTQPNEKVEVCGLPGKPACKIDETGTPSAEAGSALQKPAVDALEQSKVDAIANVMKAGLPADKDTHWQFTFAFPSNCSPLVAWSGMSFDICRFQPVIHDLLSMLWYGSTVFLIVGMVGRTMRGGE